jgi:hypothetical protein
MRPEISIPFFFKQLIIWMLFPYAAFSQQEISYDQHIRPIIATHCNHCHQPNNVAPFSLLTYEEVSLKAKFIGFVTESRYMPPWKADTAFQHYKNENVLSDEEIGLLQKWIKTGMKRSSTVEKTFIDPHAEILYKEEKTESKYDLTVSMQKPFTLEPHGREEFRYFYVPVNNPDMTFVKSIRFIPGNRKQVHHSRLMSDTTNAIQGIDGLSDLESTIYSYQTKPLSDPFLFGWVPGNDQINFPKGTGKRLYPGTNFILNMHYAPTPVLTTDSSVIKLAFAESPVDREVFTMTLRETNISNQPFFLKADTKPKFYMRSAILQEDISLISILPHMHLLGKSFKAFAITKDGEIIPLIHIPDWDFNWQMTYMFQKYLFLPKGTVIYAEASYDNTADNLRNPFSPAKDVGYGWGVKDEMMNLVIYYVKYKKGDEKTGL